MTRIFSNLSVVSALTLGILALGCESGGVGDPCVPEDEYSPTFSGFAKGEVNVESRSFQCETRVCLVNHFQGRVSCPYGQNQAEADSDNPPCTVPGQTDPIEVPVDPQLLSRRADNEVYCSCRCDGPDANARYCECPSGYACVELVDDLGLPGGQLAGSYCVREGTRYVPGEEGVSTCSRAANNCGE